MICHLPPANSQRLQAPARPGLARTGGGIAGIAGIGGVIVEVHGRRPVYFGCCDGLGGGEDGEGMVNLSVTSRGGNDVKIAAIWGVKRCHGPPTALCRSIMVAVR